jgi:hypothetical protein
MAINTCENLTLFWYSNKTLHSSCFNISGLFVEKPSSEKKAQTFTNNEDIDMEVTRAQVQVNGIVAYTKPFQIKQHPNKNLH